MKTVSLRKARSAFAAYAVVSLAIGLWPKVWAQGLPISAYDLVQKVDFASAFGGGKTNVPMLAMDWFSDADADEYCRVSQSGRVTSAKQIIERGTKGNHRADLDQTQMRSLLETINALPPPPHSEPPKERWIVIQGIRSNQWFKSIYDRAHIPPEVEKLYELTGASLIWFIPEVKGAPRASFESGYFACLARDKPIAVKVGNDFLGVLDMTTTPHLSTAKLKSTPYQFHPLPWQSVVISPDGKIIVLGTSQGLHAIDWKADTQLWQAGNLEQDGGRHNNALAIGGDKGQFLFAAGAHTVERWDLLTGKKLATLATNQPVVKLLATSRDGSTLIAGFNDDSSAGSLLYSFWVWEAEKNEPVERITEKGLMSAGISPDGSQIVLSIWGQSGLTIYNRRTEQRSRIPARFPYSASHAYAMYWSPDGKRMAARVDGMPASVVVYDTVTWAPIARWDCEPPVGQPSKFAFTREGMLLQVGMNLQMQGGEINALDVAQIKSPEN